MNLFYYNQVHLSKLYGGEEIMWMHCQDCWTLCNKPTCTCPYRFLWHDSSCFSWRCSLFHFFLILVVSHGYIYWSITSIQEILCQSGASIYSPWIVGFIQLLWGKICLKRFLHLLHWSMYHPWVDSSLHTKSQWSFKT